LPWVLKEKAAGESGVKHFSDVTTNFLNAWNNWWDEIWLKSPSKVRYKSSPLRQTEMVGFMTLSCWGPGKGSNDNGKRSAINSQLQQKRKVNVDLMQNGQIIPRFPPSVAHTNNMPEFLHTEG
jgi:hypothetical protein